MPAETSRAICSLIFSGTLEKCKNLRICFAHGGGAFPYTLGRIEHGFAVRPDLCAVDNPKNPRQYLGQFWLDSLVHEAEMLAYLVKLVGAEKVALGTDYPFPLGEEIAGSLIDELSFDAETKAKLLHQSALDWLNLEKNDYL
jgi:aminocarboxymuconate-semialdehyde decarboxylase